MFKLAGKFKNKFVDFAGSIQAQGPIGLACVCVVAVTIVLILTLTGPHSAAIGVAGALTA